MSRTPYQRSTTRLHIVKDAPTMEAIGFNPKSIRVYRSKRAQRRERIAARLERTSCTGVWFPGDPRD